MIRFVGHAPLRTAAKRRTITATVAPARRKPEPSPDLFEAAGVVAPRNAPSFDPARLKKWALGIWRVSMDARDAILTERYFASQGITLPEDVGADVVRFHSSLTFGDDRAPALVFLVRDVFTDEPVGILRYFLADDGSVLAKRSLGRTSFNAAVKLSGDGDVEDGLHVASSIEGAIAAMSRGHRPLWCVIGESALASFPVLSGVECLSVIGNEEDASARAVEEVASRWRDANREVIVIGATP
jgi:hypothetical protein